MKNKSRDMFDEYDIVAHRYNRLGVGHMNRFIIDRYTTKN